MNEKLSDYIDRNLIKTARSQLRLSDTLLTLKSYRNQSFKIRYNLYNLTNKSYIIPRASQYFRDFILVKFYKFSWLESNDYRRNQALHFDDTIKETLKIHKISMNESLKYYRRTK